MHPSLRKYLGTVIFGVALLVLPGLAAAQTDPTTCDITGATTVNAGETFHLCGVNEGAGFTYSWYDQNGALVGHNRCQDFGPLPVGDYNIEYVVSFNAPEGPFKKCPITLHVVGTTTLTCPDAVTACSDSTITVCGQSGEGLTYTWTGDGLLSGEVHTRCVTIGPLAPGDYTLHYVVSLGEQFLKCDVPVHVTACVVNCPRTAGFWTQQCTARNNGSTKFTSSQMSSIIACVDARSALDLGGFCAIVNPSKPMDVRKQALRQYAVLLANVCTGELGLVTTNGEHILLDTNTAISCGELNVNTIGEFIARADSLLGALAGGSLSDATVRSWYGAIAACADSINNGFGIGPVCSEEGDDEDGMTSGAASAAQPLVVTPNPLREATRMQYAVTPAGARVQLAIYDIAGRQVRALVSSFQPGGSYQLSWDGRDASGARVKTGVYFVRGSIGTTPLASRIVVVR